MREPEGATCRDLRFRIINLTVSPPNLVLGLIPVSYDSTAGGFSHMTKLIPVEVAFITENGWSVDIGLRIV